jgi:hypothetical protein
MRREAGHNQCLTLALVVSLAYPDRSLDWPVDDAPRDAAAATVTESGARTGVLRRRPSHALPRAPRAFVGDDQTDDSDDGDDVCPSTPAASTSPLREFPLLIPGPLRAAQPIPGPTPTRLGVSCRLRC